MFCTGDQFLQNSAKVAVFGLISDLFDKIFVFSVGTPSKLVCISPKLSLVVFKFVCQTPVFIKTGAIEMHGIFF